MVKKIAFAFVLIFGSISISIGICETVIASLNLAPDYKFYPGLFTNHPKYDYAMKRNFRGEQGKVKVLTNENSLRVSGQTGLLDGKKIVILGDSLVFGWGVKYEEAFPAVLEKLLRKKSGMAPVINAGVPGYSLWHYYNFLKNQIYQLNPQTVILALSGNDHMGREWEANAKGSLSKKESIVKRSSITELVFNNSLLSRHSGTYRLLKNFSRDVLYQVQNKKLSFSFLATSAYAMEFPSVGSVWEKNTKYLELIGNLCKDKNIKLLIVDFTDTNGLSNDLQMNGFDVVHHPLIRNDDDFLPADGHPNRRGHYKIAEHIFTKINSKSF